MNYKTYTIKHHISLENNLNLVVVLCEWRESTHDNHHNNENNLFIQVEEESLAVRNIGS